MIITQSLIVNTKELLITDCLSFINDVHLPSHNITHDELTVVRGECKRLYSESESSKWSRICFALAIIGSLMTTGGLILIASPAVGGWSEMMQGIYGERSKALVTVAILTWLTWTFVIIDAGLRFKAKREKLNIIKAYLDSVNYRHDSLKMEYDPAVDEITLKIHFYKMINVYSEWLHEGYQD